MPPRASLPALGRGTFLLITGHFPPLLAAPKPCEGGQISACQRVSVSLFLGPKSRRCPEAHRRGQPLHSEAGNAKNAPESTICGVPRKRSTTTGSGPWLAPNFLFQKPPSQGRPDQSTVWPKPAWNGSAWKTTTTDRNCRTHKACCTAVASLLQHQGAKAQSRGKLCSDPARVFTV